AARGGPGRESAPPAFPPPRRPLPLRKPSRTRVHAGRTRRTDRRRRRSDRCTPPRGSAEPVRRAPSRRSFERRRRGATRGPARRPTKNERTWGSCRGVGRTGDSLRWTLPRRRRVLRTMAESRPTAEELSLLAALREGDEAA